MNFLQAYDWDVAVVLQQLKESKHLRRELWSNSYPWLRGDKIGPLWLRMLWDNAGVSKLRNLERAPIPVDVHVARATLALGIVRGKYSGPLDALFDDMRKAWFESVLGLKVAGRAMIALDVDEPLWHLSKDGCSKRDPATAACPVRHRCEAAQWCVDGQLHCVTSHVELDT